MSNCLTKPYEISLWKDGPSGEERICIIGTDTMEGQNRALEPIFSRNVNGVKKLSFKIYKKYVDTQTGEEVDNPYIPYLISERKVKLYLREEPSDNQWHDFIIKNVSENSVTHLCTYQLEDALVQELSKNGFGVTLDVKLMNNIGTANELAEYVLRETDWRVSDNSEAFVQTIDEALVYLTFPQNPTSLKVYKIIGQKENNRKIGVTADKLDSLDDLKGKTILAFYSSCTGKPHRFQFLYSKDGTYNTEEELKNYISNETDYQYYIDFDNPEENYTVRSSNYTLPIGFATTTHVEYENGTATALSSKYRGRRYGFSQQAKYIPVLDRYVQLYKKGNQEYYGYEHAEYKSPALTQNMISNSTFESTSGWTGTKKEVSGEKAKVEAVYGYFDDTNKFVSAIEDLQEGKFDPKSAENPDGKDYKAYLKLEFKGINSTVINSGPFDNRTLIGNMVAGDEWALWSEVIGPGILNFTLGEYKYSSTMDGYNNISGEISFSNVIKTETKGNKTYSIYTVESSSSSKESFKKNMNVRLQISASVPGEYYLEAIELFKVARCNNTIIPLDEQADSLEDRVVEKTYYYFTDSALDGITNAEQLRPKATAKTLSYTTYKPVYNNGAQKVRTVTAKESNYFNILQSIAETFEAWLTFDISRNNDGGIQEKGKKIAFKNYVGGDNYACFRYGVNLKDIERTFESKNIVTKLIVKNNSNEHANGGFCTIQRASANPTGENYIYDFQYFFNQGLMNDREYLDTLYALDKTIEGIDYYAYGEDCAIWEGEVFAPTKTNPLNLQGYFPRIKALNNKIQTESELLTNIAQDLTKYKADLAVAEAGLDAATSGIEEVREEFLLLTGAHIDQNIAIGDFTNNSGAKKKIEEYAVYTIKESNYSQDKIDAQERVDALEAQYNTKQNYIESSLKKWKRQLNQLFFQTYSFFIQEGTWISEEYVDDSLYYADAQSVMYNSCYPQVAYTINVISVEGLPGYEDFKYKLGEKTWVVDPDFFGDEDKESVIITEIVENLDDRSKNQFKVQNFKNQFQDLFQKITATVQQTQYSTGSYEKAVALAEANQERKNQFLSEALDGANSKFFVGKQPSVRLTNEGLLIENPDSPSDAIKMVGGAILLSKQDENGQQKWVTGVTSDGVSASLITAGILRTGEITIMNYDEPVFRWDAYGISAYDAYWSTIGEIPTISRINTKKFVRFDKFGIYGVNNAPGVDGATWYPNSIDNVVDTAAYYLTWDGLQVVPQNIQYTQSVDGNNQPLDFISTPKTPTPSALKLGRVDEYIYNDWHKDGYPYYDKEAGNSKTEFVKVFSVGEKVGNYSSENFVLYSDGTLVTNKIKLTGSIEWTDASSPSKNVYGETNASAPADGTKYTSFDNEATEGKNWHKKYNPQKDNYYCHTDNGGATWLGPFYVEGKSATSYELIPSENLINMDDWEDGKIVAFTVNKIVGDESSQMTAGYEIRLGNELIEKEYKIPEGFLGATFKLFIDGNHWDTKTVGAVYNGKDGDDAITCYIDSQEGNFFPESEFSNSEKEITLTARIFSGNKEIDQSGEFVYTWYIDGNANPLKDEKGNELNSKTITILLSNLKNTSIYFKAVEETTEQKGE